MDGDCSKEIGGIEAEEGETGGVDLGVDSAEGVGGAGAGVGVGGGLGVGVGSGVDWTGSAFTGSSFGAGVDTGVGVYEGAYGDMYEGGCVGMNESSHEDVGVDASRWGIEDMGEEERELVLSGVEESKEEVWRGAKFAVSARSSRNEALFMSENSAFSEAAWCEKSYRRSTSLA
jgi:hypothetical protein